MLTLSRKSVPPATSHSQRKDPEVIADLKTRYRPIAYPTAPLARYPQATTNMTRPRPSLSSSPTPAATVLTKPDIRTIPFTPKDLLDKTKENNAALEKLVQERKNLEEKCRQLQQKHDRLELEAEELKYGCKGKLHSMECPRMIRLKDEWRETVALYRWMERRAEGYSLAYRV